EPRDEAALLLLVADREPVLEQDDAVVDEEPLEDRTLAEEPPVLLLRAEAQHVLDAGPRVPAAVEENDLAGGGEVGDVALEIPLAAFRLGGRGERDDPGLPRVQVLGDPLDRAALPGRVAALEEDGDPGAGDPHPLLELHELGLQAQQLLLVEL